MSKRLKITANGKTLQAIVDLQRRCEHKDPKTLIRHAITTYDVLTEAVAKGSKIVIIHADGSQGPLELSPP